MSNLVGGPSMVKAWGPGPLPLNLALARGRTDRVSDISADTLVQNDYTMLVAS